jgi:hypothetical protein
MRSVEGAAGFGLLPLRASGGVSLQRAGIVAAQERRPKEQHADDRRGYSSLILPVAGRAVGNVTADAAVNGRCQEGMRQCVS